MWARATGAPYRSQAPVVAVPKPALLSRQRTRHPRTRSAALVSLYEARSYDSLCIEAESLVSTGFVGVTRPREKHILSINGASCRLLAYNAPRKLQVVCGDNLRKHARTLQIAACCHGRHWIIRRPSDRAGGQRVHLRSRMGGSRAEDGSGSNTRY